MKLIGTSALVLGLAAVIALVAWHGVGTVAAALAGLGAAVLVLPLLYAPHIAGAAFSWRQVFPPALRPHFAVVLRAMWIGLAAESLVPGASFGAEIVKARQLLRAGLSGRDAASLVIVDMAIQGLVLAVWGVLGLGGLIVTLAAPQSAGAAGRGGSTLIAPALFGAGLLATAILALILAQRAGFFGFLARLGSRAIRDPRWQGVIDGAAQLDQAIRGLYGQPGRIVLATAIRCCSRAMLLAELIFAAGVMGQALPVAAAAMLVGLIGALRAAAFVVPGGWGVQEGGFVLLGGLAGLDPETMLALSLAIRARELMLFVPALLAWQAAEARALRNLARRNLARRRAAPDR